MFVGVHFFVIIYYYDTKAATEMFAYMHIHIKQRTKHI